MNPDELIAALQAELDKHSWPEYPVVDGTVATRCNCGAEVRAASAWLQHLRNDVLPKVISSNVST